MNGTRLLEKYPCDWCKRIHTQCLSKGGSQYCCYVFHKEKLCLNCIKKVGVL